MPKKIVLLILVLIVCSWSVVGQEEGEQPKIVLPDNLMSQVVERIVRWYFKPAKRPRQIHFWDKNINTSWMPKIGNVEFVLLNDNDSLKREKGVYFFNEPEFDGKTYSIGFGFGDISCGAGGGTWKFRILGDSVKLWRDGGGWGGGCGGGLPFAIRGLKVGDVSPNELPGYEFFAKGKLKGIKLGLSRKEDIEKIFGSSCEDTCNYDERWELRAEYYDDDEVYYTTDLENRIATKTSYFARPEYVKSLRSISLSPKGITSFIKITFPHTFAEGWSSSVCDSFSSNGFEGAAHTQNRSFTDGYGLSYEVFEKVTFIHLPDNNKLKQGDLINIEYKIPDALEKASVLIAKTL